MKRVSKILCLVIALVFTASMMMGCSQDEMTFMGAAMKSADVTSMSSKTELALNIDAQGLSAKDQESLDQITSIINGAKITIDQKTKRNTDNTISTSQTDVGFTVMGFALPVTLWSDNDFTGAVPKMKVIVKIPEAFSMLVSSEAGSKPYLVMDLGKMLAEDKSSVESFKQLTQLSTTMTTKITAFIKDYALQYDPGFSVITGKGESTVNGQAVSLYNLKLDDTSFKNLLAYTVPNLAKNDKAVAFIKDLLNSVAEIVGGTETASMKKELEEAFGDYQKDLPEALANWDKVMGELKNVKMLGSKGIDIDFGVNSDGYIVSAKGSVDIIYDVKALADAGEKIKAIDDNSYKPKASTEKTKIEICADFNTTISDINKDIQINLPKLTAQNSTTLDQILDTKVVTKTPSKPAVKRDTTAPGKPVVNAVTRTSKTITGKAEAGSAITVKNGKTVIGKGIANAKGLFSITIKPLKAKATLTVTAADKAGNVSKPATIIVK